ncbi:hypothetical protein Ae201684P_015228 [Aphanomyces euteiches]|nr:hypothetical protein Ae201684P_015228 [Aphanomyces euteiches]
MTSLRDAPLDSTTNNAKFVTNGRRTQSVDLFPAIFSRGVVLFTTPWLNTGYCTARHVGGSTDSDHSSIQQLNIHTLAFRLVGHVVGVPRLCFCNEDAQERQGKALKVVCAVV